MGPTSLKMVNTIVRKLHPMFAYIAAAPTPDFTVSGSVLLFKLVVHMLASNYGSPSLTFLKVQFVMDGLLDLLQLLSGTPTLPSCRSLTSQQVQLYHSNSSVSLMVVVLTLTILQRGLPPLQLCSPLQMSDHPRY